ncbi:MAG: hypothetical protein KatS3mg110_2777 [Pirellulaceae bacterium]|nr:MAG: hypothetical protein KatS3mg110_2777 [Pirellulaceae bacterium]
MILSGDTFTTTVASGERTPGSPEGESARSQHDQNHFCDIDRIRRQVRACCAERVRDTSEVVMVALMRARLDVRRINPWQWRKLIETAFAEARAALSCTG